MSLPVLCASGCGRIVVTLKGGFENGGIVCTECGGVFCDSCYDTGLGNGKYLFFGWASC